MSKLATGRLIRQQVNTHLGAIAGVASGAFVSDWSYSSSVAIFEVARNTHSLDDCGAFYFLLRTIFRRRHAGVYCTCVYQR